MAKLSRARRLPVHRIGTAARELNLGDAKVHHLPNWHTLTHPERLKVIRRIAMMRGRDPRMAKVAVAILREAKVLPRQYEKQAAALLAWVQDPKNFYYVNEPGERLQDPIYTLKVKTGDCDDVVLVLAALFESIGLPWRLVLSGRGPDKEKLRYVEGNPIPSDVRWGHIYLAVGTPAFQPSTWYFCEPTIQGVPLGWDVVSGDESYLPEMAKTKPGPAHFAKVGPAPYDFEPRRLPAVRNRSPAYEMAYGGYEQAVIGGVTAGTVVGGNGTSHLEEEDNRVLRVDWDKVVTAVLTGVAVSVSTALLLDWLNGKGLWADQGHVFARWGQTVTPTISQSVFSGTREL